MLRGAAAWALASVATGTSLFVMYVWLRSMLVALSQHGIGESLMTATLAAAYLLPFVTAVVMIAGVPAVLLITLSWGYLARGGHIRDGFGPLLRTTVIIGVSAAAVFAVAGNVAVVEHPVDSAVTLLAIAITTSVGLVLPRVVMRSLAIGRFAR